MSRLDLGLSKWATQTQIAAISAMNNDPLSQDVEDKLHRDLAAIDQSYRRPKPRSEQTILNGTGLRDKLLRAFQQDFVPYESTTSLSVNPTSVSAIPTKTGDKAEIVDDGIVAPQHFLKAEDVDAKPTLASSSTELSGGLVRNQMIRSWAMRHRAEGEIVKSDGDPYVPLNPSQLRAIAMMLSERVSLVQGVSDYSLNNLPS